MQSEKILVYIDKDSLFPERLVRQEVAENFSKSILQSVSENREKKNDIDKVELEFEN